MNVLALDTETPRFDKKELWRGNVYGDSRKPVAYSWASGQGSAAHMWDQQATHDIQWLIDTHDLVVGFNIKHDIAYLRREGVDFSKTRIWDVQLGEFVIGRQLNKFPSLDDTAIRYGLPKKLDVVKLEYWEQGKDTCDVPPDILCKYARVDAELTLKCYTAQLGCLTPAQRTLVSLMSQDLLVLQEMEQNGLVFDEALCKERSLALDNEISKITEKLAAHYPTVPINFNSGDHLSAFLYGGTIKEECKEHIGFFKTGEKAGQPKYKNVVKEHVLPRLFEPLKGSQLVKEGVYETNEGTLKKLKGKNKEALALILSLSKLKKINGTYYKGLPKLREEMHWEANTLHGQFNQTLAGTGRLSSSKPNQQNFASEIQDIFVSQYE